MNSNFTCVVKIVTLVSIAWVGSGCSDRRPMQNISPNPPVMRQNSQAAGSQVQSEVTHPGLDLRGFQHIVIGADLRSNSINHFLMPNSQTLYFATESGVYISRNGINGPFEASSGLVGVSVKKLAGNDRVVFAITDQIGGFFYSIDRGRHFYQLEIEEFQNRRFLDVAFVNETSSLFFLVERPEFRRASLNSSVYRISWSSDRIQNHRINAHGPGSVAIVEMSQGNRRMRVNAMWQLENDLILRTPQGLFSYSDSNGPVAGVGFTFTHLADYEFGEMTEVLRRGNEVFLATADAGLFLSTDSGRNFDYLPIESDQQPHSVTGVAVLNSNIYAITSRGMFISRDLGATFVNARTELNAPVDLEVFKVFSVGSQILLSTNYGVFISEL